MEILRGIGEAIRIDVEPTEDAQRRHNSKVRPLTQKIWDLTARTRGGQGGIEESLELGRTLGEAVRLRIDRVYRRRTLHVLWLKIPLPL